MNPWQERNEGVIKEFRANGGKVEGWAPLILLTTKGARSGQERIIPLMYVPDGDRILAVASKGGNPKHPDWYLNILAHPEVTVEVGNEKFTTAAKILTGEERARAYKRAAEVFPPYAEYQQKTSREIPVIALDRPTK
ncbi:nitroreductase family deazaflavin-dependent oxidoreductase [Dictyobacter aurantiacus]|uniref:nitroreductase family deazaflavin-dependent oxidoreductase n=1 Tax=Dictyobacter aurantiacus TaxID=1936993 RepID=UPI000F81CFEE|nr:nitroreductase family deazaflavin-dependent oxidoreductase [Dictyobacter aurantiacus]